MDRKEIGYFGEKIVAEYLEKNGYEILKRNFTIRGGEIDIIAVKGEIIAFVEVKTRAENFMVGGVEAVTMSKRRLIIRAAEAFLLKFPYDLQPRFDVCEVILRGNSVLNLNYIENAFDNSL